MIRTALILSLLTTPALAQVRVHPTTVAPGQAIVVHWQGKDILCSPKPFNGRDIPMAVATETPEMMAFAGARV